MLKNMFEFVEVTERTGYIESPAKIGVWRTGERDVWLIDSGNDKDAGRKINKLAESRGWKIAGILNTHSNADHIGGNAFLQNKTQCKIVSTDLENAFARHPILETSFLYGGYPCKVLRNKFLFAASCEPTGVVERDLPEGISALRIPGHFFDMVAYKTPDDVWFLGDCLFSEAIISKYHLFFVYDVAAFLKTLDELETLQGVMFVPSHAPAASDIKPLIAVNRAKILEIGDFILNLCAGGAQFDVILKGVFDHYGLMMDFNQYVLIGSAVRSYLSWLLDSEKLEAKFENNQLIWVKK